jgi:hypothetical protein
VSIPRFEHLYASVPELTRWFRNSIAKITSVPILAFALALSFSLILACSQVIRWGVALHCCHRRWLEWKAQGKGLVEK